MSLEGRVSNRHRFELAAFARYCAKRIQRELGAERGGEGLTGWTVSLESRMPDEVTATVRVRRWGRWIEASGLARDPALAIWEAMCRIEQPLRELRAA